jgi:hypothetical protein
MTIAIIQIFKIGYYSFSSFFFPSKTARSKDCTESPMKEADRSIFDKFKTFIINFFFLFGNLKGLGKKPF